ncbi:MAG: hypothetical protein SOR73_13275 [Romboutsia timonensis]|uniref:hypothetical protein n=1 Tax=Romboutsia timonensis TaxID=1776391 RepID=UPI002A762BEC|nr:hypothetical protein [Romboutsia timonensis]MDY3002626.1 hypothetical protein [Romboutsia timonensis]
MLNKRIRTYSFYDFRTQYTSEDITLVNRIISHIQNNKIMYTRLILVTALLLHFNINFVFANEVGTSLDATFNQLIELLKDFAKWGCLGMGLKKLVEEMLSGANFKQASVAGMQYWLCYIFIQSYPKLFDMIKM